MPITIEELEKKYCIYPKIKRVSFRIRQQYFKQIKNGRKKCEYRAFTERWRKILRSNPPPRVAVFVCGKEVHRREITAIYQIPTPIHFSSQGKADVPTKDCFAIWLGKSVEN